MWKRLKDRKNTISDEDSMIHTLNNLPEEYEIAFDGLERTIDDPNNPLIIEATN